MSQSLRVSVCSNCGHLLVRAASCSGNATRNRTIQYSARRSVSWGSLFDHLRGKRVSKELPTPIKPSEEEARKRTGAVVRRLREAKDRAGRPPPPPPLPPPPPTSTPQRPSTPSTVGMPSASVITPGSSSPGKPRKDTLSPFVNLKTPIPPIPTSKPRKVSQQPDRSNDADILFPKSRSHNPFLSPLKAERMEAMHKYLQMAQTQTSSKDGQPERRPYPWEELTPVPWDTEAEKLSGVRRLLDLRAPELSRKRAEKGFSSSYIRKAIEFQRLREQPPRLDLDAANESTNLETSKLYLHLRDHHIRTVAGYDGPGSEEVKDANRELFHRIDIATQALKDQYPGKPWAESFSEWLPSNTVGEFTITPFIKYILANEGFDPTSCQITQPRVSQIHDNLGCLKQTVLIDMIDECNIQSLFSLSLVYRRTVSQMHPRLVKTVVKVRSL
jgi:hypothetical protein